MLGLSTELKKTRFYQEVLEEGKEEGKQETKLETIPRLLPLGLSLEQIAQALDLPLEVVQQTAQSTRSQITSVEEQNVAVFNQLLNSQPSLFSPEDRNELVELIAPLPDESNLLYLTLSGWYEKHPEILKAQLTMVDELFGNRFSQDKGAGSTEGKVTPPINPANKQTLLNSIQQS